MAARSAPGGPDALAFAGATALVAATAVVLALVAARTTVLSDVT